MAYTDGLMILGAELSAVQIETAAAIVKQYVVPANVTILQWGVLVTEDFTDHTSEPTIALRKASALSGTATTIESMIMSTTSLFKKGDGTKEAQTAIALDTDIDNGHVLVGNPQNMPVTVKAGEILMFEVTTAATSAGGAFIPFAVLRIDGEVDRRQTTVWTKTL